MRLILEPLQIRHIRNYVQISLRNDEGPMFNEIKFTQQVALHEALIKNVYYAVLLTPFLIWSGQQAWR